MKYILSIFLFLSFSIFYGQNSRIKIDMNEKATAVDFSFVNDKSFTLQVAEYTWEIEKDRVEYNDNGAYTYVGKISDEPYFFTFYQRGDYYEGGIVYENNLFEFKYDREGVYYYVDTMVSNSIECGTIDNHNDTPNSDSDDELISYKNSDVASTADCQEKNCNSLRILVLYTPKLERKKGMDDIEARVDREIAQLNTSFSRSNIPFDAVLVGLHSTHSSDGFEKSGNIFESAREAITKLKKPNDGFVDYHVTHLRRETQADIIVLLNFNKMLSGIAGIASSNGGHRDSIPCAIVGYKPIDNDNAHTFQHEIGHLLGGRHQTNTDVDPYADGHAFQSASYSTMMIEGETEGNTNHIRYWSSPSIDINGETIGSYDFANNSRVLNEVLTNHALGYRQLPEFLEIENQNYTGSTQHLTEWYTHWQNSNTTPESCTLIEAGNEIIIGSNSRIQGNFHAKIDNPYCGTGNIPNSEFPVYASKKGNTAKENQSPNLFTIYPNPIGGDKVFYIHFAQSEIIERVTIYSMNGVIIQEFDKVLGGGNDYRFKLSEELAKGIYFINIHSSINNYYEKVIID